MQALVIAQENQHQIDDLVWQDRPTLVLGADDVLIQVKAAGLNPVDYKVIESGGPAWQYPHTTGLDVAGIVQTVGANVRTVRPGQRVCGHGNLAVNGAFAEQVALPAGALALIPATVSFETAAASLCAGLTAYQALYRKANLTNVHTVLIHAGAGGVGSLAIQLAKAAGKTVYTTVSAGKRAFVEQLRPDAIIDYHTTDVTARIRDLTQNRGVDVVVNTIGHPDADVARLAYNGQLVCVLDTPTQVPANQALTVSNLDLGGAHRSGNFAQVADLGRMTSDLLALIAAGKVDPLVSQVLTPQEIPAGLRQLKAHQVVGKLVARFA